MARTVLQIVRAHPELRELSNVIPSLHYLAAEHRIGSWKSTERGFVKHFGPKQEEELLSRLTTPTGTLRYDPYR